MQSLLAPLYMLIRLLRRAEGVHAAPRRFVREAADVIAAPTCTAARVRPYVRDIAPLLGDAPDAPAWVRPYWFAAGGAR